MTTALYPTHRHTDDCYGEIDGRVMCGQTDPLAIGSKYDGLDEFRALMDGKLRFGDEKYGADSWGRHDMLAEAMAEMVDLGNYAYLKWRQLKVLQERLDADAQPRSLTGEDRLGVQS